MSVRFLRSIGYYGLVELEYKHDQRDGLTKLLDVNARTWGYHSLGQRAGVDFPYLLYADQIGLPALAASRLGTGISWIRLATDLPTAAWSWRDAGSTGGPICGRCACWTSSRSSRPTTYVLASPSLPCCPISQSREVSELIVDEVMTGTPRRRKRRDGPPSVVRSAADIEVAVIGAGPHGLSAAVHLRRAGVDAQVFGAPMSFWRGMPKGMRLRSNMSATNMIEPVGPLSLASYMAEIGEQFGHPVSLRRFVDYGTLGPA